MIGVVLAGGRSSRMGVDKATVEIGGRTMLETVVDALRSATDEVVVAGHPAPGTRSIPDGGPAPRGPLAGLAAAAGEFPSSALVVVAVDQPWVRPETLRRLLAIGGDLPVVPVDEGVRQTTCAVYPTDALDQIADELSGGGSIQSLLDRVSFRPVVEEEWSDWGEDGRSWFSVDTPAAIDEGIRRYGTP